MALMKRTRDEESEWPAWPGRRSLLWPESVRDLMFKDLMDQSELKVEEYQDEGELVVRVEIPDIDPDNDVELTVSDHELRLRVERRSESTTEDKKGYRSEFRYGSFSRTIRLPAGATEDDVRATYTDGILEVRIPLDDDAATAKKIPIGRG